MEKIEIREAGIAAGLKGVELRRAEVYMDLGYTIDEALNLSARYCPSSHLYRLENGQFMNTVELAEHSGISKGKVRKLITSGISATDIYNGKFDLDTKKREISSSKQSDELLPNQLHITFVAAENPIKHSTTQEKKTAS